MEIDFARPVFTPSSPRTWPPLLTIAQTSQILNMSPWTLRKWDNEGKLPAVRVGSRKDRRYRREDVMNVLQKGV